MNVFLIFFSSFMLLAWCIVGVSEVVIFISFLGRCFSFRLIKIRQSSCHPVGGKNASAASKCSSELQTLRMFDFLYCFCVYQLVPWKQRTLSICPHPGLLKLPADEVSLAGLLKWHLENDQFSFFFAGKFEHDAVWTRSLLNADKKGLNGFSAESRLSASQRKKAAVTRDRHFARVVRQKTVEGDDWFHA